MSRRYIVAVVATALFALGALIALMWTSSPLRAQEVAKKECYPQWSKMTAVDQNKIYLELYPGTIYYVVSTVEVYDICNKELQWNVTPAEASPVDKRVMWTLQDYTPLTAEQRGFLLKNEGTELILLTSVEIWKVKNGWTKEGVKE
jgi:hypothetical protein